MKLRWTFANILSLSVINWFGIQAQGVNVTVITQPDNTTACEGGTAVFTCVMNISNINISIKDIEWWRIRLDQDSSKPLQISEAVKRYNISDSINEHRVTNTLMITNVSLLDMGPYWPGLNNDEPLCSMAFLSIISQNGISPSVCAESTTGINPTAAISVTTGTTITADTTTTAAAATTTTTDTTTSTTDANTNTATTPTISTTTTIVMATTNFTATNSVTIFTATVDSTNVLMSSVKNNTTSDSGGSSGGAIAGGVIGAILVIVIIVIIIIFIYYFVFYRNKDNNDDGKSPYYSVIASGSSRNGKNTIAVSNSIAYDEEHRTEAKTVPHQTTETGELYAMSTKAADQDTHNEPSMLYAYARVDLDMKRKITEASVPHQTATDGAQYAVSTKVAAAKDDHATDNDVNQNTENKEIKYADLQPLPTSPEMSNVRNESSSPYTQIAT